ncbi:MULTISPECIES: hypothetical protein [Burkholderia cepacia complex]|uniref:hypothetical protein n=1 Tax=Burkholderia cepacia complex TaxID=87882 RepID=UPI0007585BA4|nr:MULTISPECIES: hypothetical protein [Burkholderia cepacia complex]KVR67892.1 hypothetical protein WK24_13110 [Burkholderia vietnamiensis]
MNFPEKAHAQTVESLLDAAGKVLEATYEDEGRARRAIESLEKLSVKVENKLNSLADSVVSQIDSSAGKTAETAAKLLQDKFVEADTAAEQARDRYDQAAQRLGWRLFGLAVLLQLLIFAGVWLIVRQTFPSQEEINTRQEILRQQAQQISDLDQQIKTKQHKVNDLDRRGAKVEWTTCHDDDGQSHLCFRVDGQTGDFGPSDRTKIYRIPLGY